MYLYDSMTKIMNLFISKDQLLPNEILKKYFNELQLWRNEENEIDILVQLVNAIRPRNPKVGGSNPPPAIS